MSWSARSSDSLGRCYFPRPVVRPHMLRTKMSSARFICCGQRCPARVLWGATIRPRTPPNASVRTKAVRGLQAPRAFFRAGCARCSLSLLCPPRPLVLVLLVDLRVRPTGKRLEQELFSPCNVIIGLIISWVTLLRRPLPNLSCQVRSYAGARHNHDAICYWRHLPGL